MQLIEPLLLNLFSKELFKVSECPLIIKWVSPGICTSRKDI